MNKSGGLKTDGIRNGSKSDLDVSMLPDGDCAVLFSFFIDFEFDLSQST
jgi:hypothetical protein